jgi:Cys-tRNA(Pro) deacylase
VSELSASASKVQQVLQDRGFSNQIIELEVTARSAIEAAEAVGVEVGQIAKSLIFKTRQTHQPVLVIASGANRVDEKKVSNLLGEKIEKADADFVREQTGFAIGGIPPVGHARTLKTLIDEDLIGYEVIWAAGGTPNALFKLTGSELVTLTRGEVAEVKK